jgi:hypothetical protein
MLVYLTLAADLSEGAGEAALLDPADRTEEEAGDEDRTDPPPPPVGAAVGARPRVVP